MKQKKVPMRMCIGCREMHPKRELIRIVLPKDGVMASDPTGKAHGRGVYVCRKAECLTRAKKQKTVRIPLPILEELEQEILGG